MLILIWLLLSFFLSLKVKQESLSNNYLSPISTSHVALKIQVVSTVLFPVLNMRNLISVDSVHDLAIEERP